MLTYACPKGLHQFYGEDGLSIQDQTVSSPDKEARRENFYQCTENTLEVTGWQGGSWYKQMLIVPFVISSYGLVQLVFILTPPWHK